MPTDLKKINLNLGCDLVTEAIIKPMFIDSPLGTFFNLDVNAREKKPVPYIKFLEDVLRQSTGCTPEEVDLVEITSRLWKIWEHSSRSPFCYDQVMNTPFANLLNAGVSKANMTNTQLTKIYIAAFQHGISKGIYNNSFFGKRDMADIAGYKHLQVTDGLWSVLLPQLDTAGDLQFVEENAVLVGGSGDTIKFIRKVIKNQTIESKGLLNTEKLIGVDNVTYENLKEDLQAIHRIGGFTESTTGGLNSLMLDGISVVDGTTWGTTLTGLSVADATHPNFVLLTAKQNNWVGFDVTAPSMELDMFYDKVSKKVLIDSSFSMGFNYAHAELFSVGFNRDTFDSLKAK